MDYNTNREKILMPEYGREVQEMVEYAITIPDRATRQRAAETIVRVMANFNPQFKGIQGFHHKLWDHLAMISGYKLDIDYPYEITVKTGSVKPEPMKYPMTKIRYRHYGHLLETLLDKIAEMPEGAERDELTRITEGQMRRSLENWNKSAIGGGGKVQKDVERFTRKRPRI
jgi:hypothetical protein